MGIVSGRLVCAATFTPVLKYDIFVNCNWVVTRWLYYITHLYTDNT